MENNTDLRTRIARLRDRIRSPEMPRLQGVTDEPPCLDHRLWELRRKVRQRAAASAQDLETLTDQVVQLDDDRDSTELLTVQAAGLIRRFEERLESLRDLERRSTLDVAEAGLGPAPLERAINLAELGLRLIHEAGQSPTRQVRMLPALEEIDRHLIVLTGETADRFHAAGTRREQINDLRVLHRRVVAGELPDFDRLGSLAAQIIATIEREYYPALEISASADPGKVVAEHALNVAQLTAFLAHGDVGWRAHRQSLVIAALLADVGMLRLSPGYFSQSDPLTADQIIELQRHPLYAQMTVEQAPGFDAQFSTAVAMHHERLDGSGYPAGLTADQIPAAGRLLAVADALASRRRPRLDRPAPSQKDALTEMLADADAGRLDRAWVGMLLNLSLYPVGALVELSTGELARVVAGQQTNGNPALGAMPIVRLERDGAGQPIHVPLYRNLAQQPHCRIVREMSPFE